MNEETWMTLDAAVGEVLGALTGLELEYDPAYDRYRAVTRQLNRALRDVALENEWAWYAANIVIGTAAPGDREARMPLGKRLRVVNDDAVRLLDGDGRAVVWAYILPRDSLHKYAGRDGLWCSVTSRSILFSRPFTSAEAGLEIQVPAMREPRMLKLPKGQRITPAIRNQSVDFQYPDLVTARATYLYAQTDPVMQPRVPTLQEEYKSRMYQMIERDTASTDTPYMNEFRLPLHSGLVEPYTGHYHPHSD